MRRPLIAGNWKLHKTIEETETYAKELIFDLGEEFPEIVIAPAFTALAAAREAFNNTPVRLAAQNCHPEPSGAFTGEVSAAMIKDAGCDYVILGHSERRQYFGETDGFIRDKLLSALKAHLLPILCIGEMLEDREDGKTEAVLAKQLQGALNGFLPEQAEHLTIAYEPVWAIGTGKTATPEIAQETHLFIRNWLQEQFSEIEAQKIRILYGGSVKPENIDQLMAQMDIDGALVGGASLQPEDFLRLIHFRTI